MGAGESTLVYFSYYECGIFSFILKICGNFKNNFFLFLFLFIFIFIEPFSMLFSVGLFLCLYLQYCLFSVYYLISGYILELHSLLCITKLILCIYNILCKYIVQCNVFVLLFARTCSVRPAQCDFVVLTLQLV